MWFEYWSGLIRCLPSEFSPLVEWFGRKAVDQLFLPCKGEGGGVWGLVPLSSLFIIRIERKNNWPHLEICDTRYRYHIWYSKNRIRIMVWKGPVTKKSIFLTSYWVVCPLYKKVISKMLLANHKRGELMLSFWLFIFNLGNDMYRNRTIIYYDTTLFLILYWSQVVGGVTKCTLD